MPSNSENGTVTGWGSYLSSISERGIPGSQPVWSGGSGVFSRNSFDVNTEQNDSDVHNPATVQEEPLMATVADNWGHRFPTDTLEKHPLIVGNNRVGVEVELENIRNSMPSSRFWRTEPDGSLRNHGCEFVFQGPIGGRDLFHALTELDSHLFESNPDASWRCSTHVHLDVRDLTAKQVKNLILTYLVYERVLFRCSGWHRLKNNFCPALCFAEQMLQTLSTNWNKRDRGFFSGVRDGWNKYSAMNLLPMGNFGSIEFRMAEGKWRKGHLIKHCNRLLSLKEFAVSWEGNFQDLIMHLVETHPSRIIKKGLPKDINCLEEDIEIGAKCAFDVINMASIREKHEVLMREHNPTNDEDNTTTFRVRGNHRDVFRMIADRAEFPRISWITNGMRENNRMPVEMTYMQLADCVSILGCQERWLVPPSHHSSFTEWFTEVYVPNHRDERRRAARPDSF